MDIKLKIKGQNFGLPKKPKVLLVVTSIVKSNFWVTLLSWKIIGEVVTHIIQLKGDSIENYSEDEKRILRENYDYIIYPDDMIYTGEQFFDNINSLAKLLKQLSPIALLVPFITDRALIRIEKSFTRTKILNPSKTKIMLSFKTILNDEWLLPNNLESDEEIEEYIRNKIFTGDDVFHIGHRQALVYFDHKIADSVSLPIFLLGPNTPEFLRPNLNDQGFIEPMQGEFIVNIEDPNLKGSYKLRNYTYDGNPVLLSDILF